MKIILRKYQAPIVESMLDVTHLKPYVLGSAPGSGKTEMIINVIQTLFERNEINNVLILAHSTNILKANFYERLLKYFDSLDVGTFKDETHINPNAKIQVLIPQNIRLINKHYDVVIVDEAHHNVITSNEESLYSKIIDIATPNKIYYLTGTPSKFIREKDKYNIDILGVDEIGSEYFHNLKVDLVKSDYDFVYEDINQHQEILSNVDFKKEQTINSIDNIIYSIIKNILDRKVDIKKDFKNIAKVLYQNNEIGKTLIMCKRIKQAEEVHQRLLELFGGNKIGLSTSDNDKDTSIFNKFKDGELNILVVVGRGREGYDDYSLRNVVDLTMTHNIDLIYQMFSRAIRKDKDNKTEKLFIKATLSVGNLPEYTRGIMTASLMLTQTTNLAKFNGKNFNDIVLPIFKKNGSDIVNEDGTIDTTLDIIDTSFKNIDKELDSDLKSMVDVLNYFNSDNKILLDGQKRFATTTLGEVIKNINKSDKEGHIIFCEENYITTIEQYKKSEERKQRNDLLFQPWLRFGDFLERISDINKLDKEGHISFCKENFITTIQQYINSDKRKRRIDLYSQPWLYFENFLE